MFDNKFNAKNVLDFKKFLSYLNHEIYFLPVLYIQDFLKN